MSTPPATLSDSHIHLFSGGFAGRSGHSPAGGDEVAAYAALRIVHQIDLALVVGYQGNSIYLGNNAFILAQAAANDWIRPLVYVDTATTAAQVAGALADGFWGVSVYATESGTAADLETLLARISSPLIERRALLSVNVVPDLYSVIARVSENFPELRLLVSHLGSPAAGGRSPGQTTAALRDLRRLHGHHTYVKASGFYALGSAMAAEHAMGGVLEAVGANRVLWGSDFPPVLDDLPFEAAVSGIWRTSLSADAIPAVMGGTLRRLLAEVDR